MQTILQWQVELKPGKSANQLTTPSYPGALICELIVLKKEAGEGKRAAPLCTSRNRNPRERSDAAGLLIFVDGDERLTSHVN